MTSKEQEREQYKRQKTTVEFFLQNKELSDREIADELIKQGIKTSSSTVGRDLINTIRNKLVDRNVAEAISQQRRLNRQAGRQKGGINYAANKNYKKDENGKFIGSNKKNK